tara:strand:+ start:188 stop:457 length:270 start_codon:yes stop_codon:yes gene_type:complete
MDSVREQIEVALQRPKLHKETVYGILRQIADTIQAPAPVAVPVPSTAPDPVRAPAPVKAPAPVPASPAKKKVATPKKPVRRVVKKKAEE